MSININLYVLKDPNTLEVKYVGQTRYTIKQRFWGHMSLAKKKSYPVSFWIMSLVEKNQKPIIEKIVSVPIEIADETEIKLIKYFKFFCNLTNATIGGRMHGHKIGGKWSDNTRLNVIKSGIYERHRKNMIENNPSKLHMKSIVQYDLNGNLIKEWDSCMSAAKSIGVRHSSLYRCCYGKFKSGIIKGFIWKFKGHTDSIQKSIDYSNKIIIKNRPVFQYDLKNKLIKKWDSLLREIEAETGVLACNISRCCRESGGYKSAGGYIWKYKKTNNNESL